MTRKLEEEDMARAKEGEEGLLYRYKGIVPIPSPGLMDDNLTVSETGFKAKEINIFMNENSALKKLQFNPKKCKFMKIGKNRETSLPNKLEVDSWNISYDNDENLIETDGERIQMDEVYEMMKYLGFVISSDASNVPNILEKKNK